MNDRDRRINRREFLINAGKKFCALSTPSIINQPSLTMFPAQIEKTGLSSLSANSSQKESSLLIMSMCGDVMTGRGIDQMLHPPSDPRIYETDLNTAVGYVKLAGKEHGPLPGPVDFSYIWRDALEEFNTVKPGIRLIHLETSLTRSNDYWQGKGIN